MSLADRITKPEEVQRDAGTAEESSTSQTPAVPAPAEAPKASSSWADEAEDDLAEKPPTVKASDDSAGKDVSSLGEAQTDGASEMLRGQVGVIEPSYEVQIKLADLQEDPTNPLFSIKSFDELGL